MKHIQVLDDKAVYGKERAVQRTGAHGTLKPLTDSVRQEGKVSGSPIPMGYVVKLLAGAARSGVRPEMLFQDAGLDVRLLAQPDGLLDAGDFTRLIQTLMRRTEDEFIGLGRGGHRSKPGTFSMMAHAVINCRNLEKAILRGAEFYKLFDSPMACELIRVGDTATVTILSGENDFLEIVLESTVFIWLRFWSWLIGRDIRPLGLEFPFPRSKEGERLARLFECPLRFDADAARIILPSAYLDRPLVQNPLSLSRFLRDSLALIIEGNARPIGLPEQIRAIISKEYSHHFPDFGEICDKLNMTPQTLRRRLKEEQTSYQAIKDDIRRDAAVFYLSKPELSIDEIALMMGFSEASSFHRAFKKWTGLTPAGYRRERLAQHDAEDIELADTEPLHTEAG